MNLDNLNLVELNAQEVVSIEGGMLLHWGWYAGAFGLGFLGTSAVIAYA